MINYLDLDAMVMRLKVCGRIQEGTHRWNVPKEWTQVGEVLEVTEWSWDEARGIMATFWASHPSQHLLVFGPTAHMIPEHCTLIEQFNRQQLRLLNADLDHEVIEVLKVCS